MEKHIKTREKILNLQVCSTGTIEEALKWAQENSPAGTSANWQIDKRECVAPVKCEDVPGRMHYIFCC